MSEALDERCESRAERRLDAVAPPAARLFPLEGLPLVAVALVAYAWLFPWFPTLHSPNELSRLYQTRALVNDHALPIDREIARRGPVGDVAVRAGHHYAAKAPGISFLGVPVYAALRAVRGGDERVTDRAGVYLLRLFGCAIPAAFAVEAMRRVLARRVERHLAASGAAIFALGTLAWPYALQLASHATTAAALLACWDGLDRCAETRRARYAAWAGFTAAMAVVLEYTSALYLLPLGAYAWRALWPRWRALAAAAAGGLPPAISLLVFQRAAFGGALSNPYAFLADPKYVAWHAGGFFGVGVPRLDVLALSYFDPARGLFAYAPFLALGFLGIPSLWRRDRAAGVLCAAAAVLGSLFTAGFEPRAWGWSVGPRHLTALCVFLVPPAVAAAGELRSRGLGWVAAILATYSIAALALVVVVCPYLPEDLTNPLHQLVLPLARQGFHVADLGEMALGRRTAWTLLPWVAAVVALAVPAIAGFGPRAPRPRALFTLGAALGAALLMLATSTLGGPDRFGSARALVRSVYEPAGAHVAALFDPP